MKPQTQVLCAACGACVVLVHDALASKPFAQSGTVALHEVAALSAQSHSSITTDSPSDQSRGCHHHGCLVIVSIMTAFPDHLQPSEASGLRPIDKAWWRAVLVTVVILE